MTVLDRRFGATLLLSGLLLAHFLQLHAVRGPQGSASSQARDGQHDFDFELGAWTVRLSRLVRPLSGSEEWVEYEGTSVVRPVWEGRANLGELRVSGPSGELEGLSLRLYDPGSGQWRISWANRADGLLGEPMVGGFEGGRGEFLNYERWNGREILVRFVFSDIAAESFRFEQAFSDDYGRTWEPNWIAVFTRVDSGYPEPEVGLSPIAPGVWIHISYGPYAGGARVSSNGLLVQHEDGLTLIDTAWGERATERLLAIIDAEVGKPVVSAIITHSHYDRIAGTHVLQRHGVPVLSLPLTRALEASSC